jgi:hypothetical protein
MAANQENRPEQNPATADNPVAQIQRLLDVWFDDDDAQALVAATELCRKNPVDIDSILTYIRERAGARNRAATALREIRKALGLPVIPGAPCRKTP